MAGREPDEATIVDASVVDAVREAMAQPHASPETIAIAAHAALAAIGSGTQGRDAVIADLVKALEAMMSMKPHKWLCDCSACVHANEALAKGRALASPEKVTAPTHGSPELDEDAAKLIAMGADPGPTFEDLAQPAASDLRERARAYISRISQKEKEPDYLEELAREFAAIRAKAKTEGYNAAVQVLADEGYDEALRLLAANRPSPTGRED